MWPTKRRLRLALLPILGAVGMLLGGCETPHPAGISGEPRSETEYINTSRTIPVASNEWISYEIVLRRGWLHENRAGPWLRCSWYPAKLSIPATQATHVGNFGGMWASVVGDINQRAAQDRIEPETYAVEFRKAQIITTTEDWEFYTATVRAYHFRNDNGQHVLLGTITSEGVEFSHLHGRTPKRENCAHNQGGS